MANKTKAQLEEEKRVAHMQSLLRKMTFRDWITAAEFGIKKNMVVPEDEDISSVDEWALSIVLAHMADRSHGWDALCDKPLDELEAIIFPETKED